MGYQLIAEVVQWLTVVAILGTAVFGLVRTGELVVKPQYRVLRNCLARLMVDARRDSDEDAAELRFRSRRDARKLLTDPNGSRISRINWQFLEASIGKQLADIATEANCIALRVEGAQRQICERVARATAGIMLILALALVWSYVAAFGRDGWWQLWPQAGVYRGVGILVSALFTAAVAWLIWRWRPVSYPAYGEDLAPQQVRPTIGRPNEPVRAINFSGGGFDTIMQLGVTHALLVIQGRAPDVVVGVSAGAVQASALAEILQAEPADTESNTKAAKRRARQEARVSRFREFVRACRTVREQLVDSVTPDAYQVDAHDPLESLKTPLAAAEERRGRQAALNVESGLVRLYNDILSLHIPIGVVVRMIRRVLGLKATSDLPLIRRYSARILELMRMWLLTGSVIARSGPLFWIAVKTILPKPVIPASADSIIFKFPPTRVMRQILQWVGFVPLLILWLGLGLIPAAIALYVAGESWNVSSYTPGLIRVPIVEDVRLLLLVLVAPYALPLPIAAIWTLSRLSWRPFIDAWSGVTEAIWLLAKWTTIVSLVVLGGIVAKHGFTIRGIDQNMLQAFQVTFGCSVSFALVVVAGVTLLISLVKLWRTLKRLGGHPDSGAGFLSFLSGGLLKFYGISRSLLDPHAVRSLFVPLFDRDYYGRLCMDRVVAASLGENPEPVPREPVRLKRVSDYSAHQKTPIHVGLAVADVFSGNLELVPPHEPVVDGLMASVAVAPFFPPVKLGNRLYVDGYNVSNVPTTALFTMLRENVHPQSQGIHIYSVVPLPYSRPRLFTGKHRKTCLNLWGTAGRALFLRRFRDAYLENRLTDIYREIIPRRSAKGVSFDIRIHPPKGEPSTFYRSWATPIELEYPASLNKNIISATKDVRDDAIAETIADGCRAALQVMIKPSVDLKAAGDAATAPCREAVRAHLKSRLGPAAELDLPGRSDEGGAGLAEICKHCALNRDSEPDRQPQSLKVKTFPHRAAYPWPHEDETISEQVEMEVKEDIQVGLQVAERGFAGLRVEVHEQIRLRSKNPVFGDDAVECADKRPDERPDENHPMLQLIKKKEWPKERNGAAGYDRPIVSLLFSGGVFRGVFQMGVLSALDQVNLKPDLVAGASIGSITGAMVAKVFAREDEQCQNVGGVSIAHPARKARVARLAAVHLGIDRLILTDRFADFVRRLTIRAADTHFSIRQADRVFRKYDYPRSQRFSKSCREVVAGIERLLYINPRQLEKLVHHLRDEEVEAVYDDVKKFVQQWLDKMGVGDQVLGAEPLGLLIENYVSNRSSDDRRADEAFEPFLDSGIHMLATATDLTTGSLEIIGGLSGTHEQASLREGLLASSAFPGVFRPRWSGELFPSMGERRQFIDGGVMDNFPIEPVVRFLRDAHTAGLVCDRPRVQDKPAPHLIFAASLETDPPDLGPNDDWTYLQESWPALWRRTRELAYNKKLESYEKAQRHFRLIYEQAVRNRPEGRRGRYSAPDLNVGLIPLDIEVLLVKPQWLCGTFAFHPMLGFRELNQAKSIAHGCASTLLRFAKTDPTYLEVLGIDSRNVPEQKTVHAAWKSWRAMSRKKRLQGACWLRPDVTCPFSATMLKALSRSTEAPLPADLIAPLSKIHAVCANPSNHMRDATTANGMLRFKRKYF